MKQNNRKILLIEPPFYRLFKETFSLSRYPLSLGYLAGTIRNETNWEVMVYNADFSQKDEPITVSYLSGIGFNNYITNLNSLSSPIWTEVKSTINNYEPDVIGISCKSQNFSSARIVAKLGKQANNQTTIIAGGPHPSMMMEDILKDCNIDIAVMGEAELTIVELLNAIDNMDSLGGIQGVIYRDGTRIIKNKPRELIDDLEFLCYPHQYAKDVLKDYELYPITAFSNIFAARGCPYNCFFCGSRNIWGRKVRFRSAANVINEIKSLQIMGIKKVHFDDDTFGVTKDHIAELCNSLINNCPGLKWTCELHVNLIDEATVILMKKAGCSLIQVGIESGNNKILKKIRKGFTIEKAISATNIIRKNGIELSAFFMVGFPDESEKTLEDTLMAMGKIDGIINYSIFTPYPGTEAFECCKGLGLIGDNYDISLYNHQSPENCFSINISKDKFRVLASRIETYVDKHNSMYILNNAYKNPFIYLKRYGLLSCFKRLMNQLKQISM
jgi:radical SAM superfamily enzyme YgiQ (UPF0313 family)